jgi:hypothetical protein
MLQPMTPPPMMTISARSMLLTRDAPQSERECDRRHRVL